MKQDVLVYINNNFPPEAVFQLKRAIALFEEFEIEGFEDNLTNILMMNDDVDPATTQDRFIGIIKENAEFILKSHTLKLEPKAKLEYYNEIMSALYLLQDLTDYTEVENVLEANRTKNVLTRIASVISAYSLIDVGSLMWVIVDYDNSLLDKLYELIEISKTASDDIKTIESRNNTYTLIKDFNEYMFNSLIETADHGIKSIIMDIQKEHTSDVLAYNLMKKGYKPNYSVKHYIPFIKEEIIAANSLVIECGVPLYTIIAYNILSLYFYSSDSMLYLNDILDTSDLLERIKSNLIDLVPQSSDKLKDTIQSVFDNFVSMYLKDKTNDESSGVL